MYIHKDFGRGHSNWLEASHNAFTRFRSKNVNLQRLHYIVSTNLALLQSNMTYMEDINYHWILDIYRELDLKIRFYGSAFCSDENSWDEKSQFGTKREEYN